MFKTLSNNKFKQFFIVNFSIISIVNIILLWFSNGNNSNPFPWNLYYIMLFISIVLLFFQYPFLVKNSTKFSKILILYVSMILFLFLFGFLSSLYLGIELIKSIIQGFITIIIGQIMGGIVAFIFIAFINIKYKKYFF